MNSRIKMAKQTKPVKPQKQKYSIGTVIRIVLFTVLYVITSQIVMEYPGAPPIFKPNLNVIWMPALLFLIPPIEVIPIGFLGSMLSYFLFPTKMPLGLLSFVPPTVGALVGYIMLSKPTYTRYSSIIPIAAITLTTIFTGYFSISLMVFIVALTFEAVLLIIGLKKVKVPFISILFPNFVPSTAEQAMQAIIIPLVFNITGETYQTILPSFIVAIAVATIGSRFISSMLSTYLPH